jgi:hypothetical protein
MSTYEVARARPHRGAGRVLASTTLASLCSAAGLLPLLLFGAACSGKPPEVAVAPEQRDLAGTWRLNRDESDDPVARLRTVQEGRPGGEGEGGDRGGFPGFGGRGRGRGGGGGRGGEGMGGAPGGGNRAAMQEGMAMLRQATERLSLTQSDTAVMFTTDLGWSRAFRTDGKTVKEQMGRGTVKIKARWQGANLVIDRDWGSGVKLSETYFRAPETGQLYVIVAFKTPRMSEPLEFRRVYDRVTGSE